MRISQKNVHSRRAQSPQPPSPQGARATNCLVFPKYCRLRKREDFRKVKNGHCRFSGEGLVIDTCASQKGPRLGITAPRSYGNAVLRNRFKRLVREVFRTYRHLLPPLDLVVLPKKGAKPVSWERVQTDFSQFIHESQS